MNNYYQSMQERKAEKYKETELDMPAVCFKLKDMGVVAIQISYNGSGDSGCIENFGLYTEESMKEDNVSIKELMEWSEWDIHNCEADLICSDEIKDYLVNFFEQSVLNDVEDWWNNDGGYGILTFDIDRMEWKCNNNCYRTETDNYYHQGAVKNTGMDWEIKLYQE